MKIFGDPCGSEGNQKVVALPIKEECLFGTGRVEKNNEERRYRKGKTDRYRRTDGYDKRTDGHDKNNYFGKNPVGEGGNILRCFRCDSTRHLAWKCPHKINQSKPSDVNEVHITLLASVPDNKQYCLIGETFGRGVLDSGCIKTVSGELWMEEYINTLPEDWRKSVKTSHEISSVYRFGDGKESTALRNVTMPVAIGKNKYMMSVDIVKNDIPLLISKKSMKTLGMKLNFLNDSADIGDKSIPLICSSTGHYSLPLTNWDLDVEDTNIVLHVKHINGLGRKEKEKKAIKLHRQFAHASKEKLVKLVKESKDFNDKEFLKCIEECCDQCEVCRKYKRPFRRPIVGLPIASQFNEVVCMDLKEYKHNKIWILHLIDAATRYSAGCLVRTKHKDEIIKQIYRIWIAYFGSPNLFLNDNGGEFSNDTFQEMNEKLNVETRTTAGESPFSNGIVERHNKICLKLLVKHQRMYLVNQKQLQLGPLV